MKKDTVIWIGVLLLCATVGLSADPFSNTAIGASNVALASARPLAVAAVIVGGIAYMFMRSGAHGILSGIAVGLVIVLGAVAIINLVGGWVGG